MTDTILVSQTRSVPELTEYVGPVALTDLLILNLPAAHDGASVGDFHVEVGSIRNAVVNEPVELPTVTDTPIANTDNILEVLAKLQAQIAGTAKAFVGITDITPQSPSNNVSNRVLSDGNHILQSCLSSTPNILVSVLAVTGSNFKPTVQVNGAPVILVRNANTDVWTGTATVNLVGPGPHTITATHSDGNVDTAVVTLETLPVVTGVVFTGAYPAFGQSQHASGQVVQLTIDANSDFVEVDVTGGAVMPTAQTFAATQSKTINVVIANQGLTTTTQTASARVRNANGTWSTVVSSSAVAIPVDGVNTLELNNTRPTVSWGSVVYSSGFDALKDTETATVNLTATNVDTVAYTSPTDELVITDPTALGAKTVTRQSGDYNVDTVNIQAVVGRTANATTATFARVVQIAHVDATLTVTPTTRLRSSVAGADYTITVTASQVVTDVQLDVGAGGVFTGTWTSLDGLVWTNTIQIADSDVRGLTAYTAASVTNLAGKVNTDTPTNNAYTIGGFTRRTLTFPPFTYEMPIGTDVVDVTKLLVTNTARGPSGIPNVTYQADIIDGPNLYTITGPVFVANPLGNRLMLTDGGFVDNNTETVGVEIEETV
jgi:hypothetical protein